MFHALNRSISVGAWPLTSVGMPSVDTPTTPMVSCVPSLACLSGRPSSPGVAGPESSCWSGSSVNSRSWVGGGWGHHRATGDGSASCFAISPYRLKIKSQKNVAPQQLTSRMTQGRQQKQSTKQHAYLLESPTSLALPITQWIPYDK